MNAVPRPGQPGQGAPQSGAAQAGQQRIQYFRPETIDKIAWLPQEEKTKYANALRNLWQNLESHPKESTEYAATQQRIAQISRSLIQRNAQIQQRRQQQAQQTGQASASASSVNTSGPAAPAARPAAPSVAATAVNTADTTAANAVVAPVAGGGGVGAAAAAAQRAQVPQAMPEHIRKHLDEIRFQAPLQVMAKGDAEVKRFLENLKRGYAGALIRMDAARQQMNRIDAMIKQRENSGNPLGPEDRKVLQARKEVEQKKHDDAHKFVEQIRRQQDQISKQKAQNGAGAASQPSQGGAAVTPVLPPTPVAAAPGTAASQGPKSGQAGAATANAGTAGDAAKGQSAGTAGQRTAQNNMNASGRQMPGPGPAGAVPTATAQTQSRVTKIEPPHPPPVNTQIASAQHPASGTPTQNSARVQTPATASAFPNSAAPATPAGQPRHSFTSALTMASQNQSTPNQATNSTPASNPGVIGAAPQQGHSHAHPPQNPPGTALPPKMPIPKNLPEASTRPPAPVSVINQSRPTLSGGTGTPAGALGQPANPRIPAYQHQDEGEHVLSKKRLDDLVRQVCGGTAEGQTAHLLTPEVEEVCPRSYLQVPLKTR